jgi:hypothetical protein
VIILAKMSRPFHNSVCILENKRDNSSLCHCNFPFETHISPRAIFSLEGEWRKCCPSSGDVRPSICRCPHSRVFCLSPKRCCRPSNIDGAVERRNSSRGGQRKEGVGAKPQFTCIDMPKFLLILRDETGERWDGEKSL